MQVTRVSQKLPVFLLLALYDISESRRGSHHTIILLFMTGSQLEYSWLRGKGAESAGFRQGEGLKTRKNDCELCYRDGNEHERSPSLSAAHDRITMSLQPFTSTIKGKDWHLSLKQEKSKLNVDWCATVWCFLIFSVRNIMFRRESLPWQVIEAVIVETVWLTLLVSCELEPKKQKLDPYQSNNTSCTPVLQSWNQQIKSCDTGSGDELLAKLLKQSQTV